MMMGETKGSERPDNSLVDKDMMTSIEFEHASKLAPAITVAHTTNIEAMIKRRILDEDWDDIIPRELPDIGGGRRKELPEVSQERSKLGLGEIYEREYLKKVSGYDKDHQEQMTKEDAIKNETKGLFANLCSKLDALSNYHFTPRPVSDTRDEVKPITTPAIAMEEVLPLHVSDARAVAPEEVYDRKRGREGVFRGDHETSQTERKRLRRSKKAARCKSRKAKLADERLVSRLQPGLGLNNPYEKRKLREELQMARASGKVITDGGVDTHTDYGLSAKYFEWMQQDVKYTIRRGVVNDDAQ